MNRAAPGQGVIDFDAAVDPASVASIDDVEKVVGILRDNGQLTAAQIVIKMGLPVTENNKRKVRAVAEASRPGIVSFPNSAGYKLLAQCTDEEKLACLAAWAALRRKVISTETLYQNAFFSLGLRV